MVDSGVLCEPILALGEAGFPQSLIDALEPLVRVDHVAILVFDHEFVPRLIGAASRLPGNVALEAARLYEQSGFYRHDPGAQQLRADPNARAPMLFRLRAADICDLAYRRRIYTRYRLIERLCLIHQVRGRWIMLNFYRGRASGSFGRGEIDCVRELSGLLANLAGKHATLLAGEATQMNRRESTAYLENLLRGLDDRLTPRERAVCARALIGLTVPGIALDLSVKNPTVATLRRRAYTKLNISSLSELFGLCISRLARARSAASN